MRSVLALVLLAAIAPAAPVPKALKKVDVGKQIVGTWKPTGRGSAWFQFHDDGTLMTWHGAEGAAANSKMNWTWALDPAADSSPRKVRLNRVPATDGGYDCLFELDGDTLRFVFLLTKGMTPPAKVEDGPNLQLHEMTRHTPTK
jgi:hypothetical protein